ncbi:cupin domain-containing protein [Streptomyces sp. RFCAC02]|uniref:cupin domain-containing protein n=1 Tax=Streptomyces sp. RFCAC02 TaxID=2499143 RepID=UPI001021214D|nr:cupin domain-containing protein [Streptomyces sp. RFCAC02]
MEKRSGARGRGIRGRHGVLAAAGAAALALVPASAGATPGTGVTAYTVAEGSAPDGISITTDGPTDVTVRVITIEPGGTTGWHYHEGPLLAVVVSGTLTRVLEDCSVEVSTAGDTVVETPGAGHVHTGRNLGTEPVVLHATYVVPEGSPLATDADPPACAS